MKTRLKNIGGICISCNCEVRDEDNWETENNADEHPDWGNIRCSECKSKWQFHNIGIGRAVIVADWERTGWRLFVFDPNRTDYGGLSDAELREELDSRDLDTVVTVAQAPAGPRRRVLKRRLLADDNQIEKRALAELLIQNNVDLETVPGDHLGKGQLQVICRENGLRDQSGYTVGEIVVLVPYSLRLGLQPGSLSGGTRSKPKPKMNAVMSLYCCVFDNNRRLRRNENTGDFISVDFIWSRLLLMSQYHGGASGIPRANLMWYVLTERFEGRRDGSLFTPRIQLGDDDSPAYIARQTARRNWRRAMKALIRIFRDAGLAREGAEGNEEE